MLAMQDFVPGARLVSEKGGFTPQVEKLATFDEAVHAAAMWIRAYQISVITIETVVLPNMWSPDEQGSKDPVLAVAKEQKWIWEDKHVRWFQFVRVWYEAPEPPPPPFR